MKHSFGYFLFPTPFVLIALLSTFHTVAEISALSPPSEHECQWRHNITDLDNVSNEKVHVLENCLYYYLVQQEMTTSGDGYQIFLAPPWESPLKIGVDRYVVHQVDALQKASSQFNIHGDINLSWKDTRLTWNETEWKMAEFALHDTHHIWTPTFSDESNCGIMDGCMSRIADVEVKKDGTVTARLTFRYPAFCGIDYYRYPEETNDCCLFLSVLETERTIKYDIQTKEKASVDKQVSISTIEKDKGITVLTNVETSAWTVQDRTVDVVKIAGFRSEFLHLCVHTKKEMSTLRIALRIPVTIATLLMLVSPLFGDLKTQSYVKLFTLTLQTICFLFMCSIAPVNG
ncbi:CRE-LGC-20 protein, partial [Aphelenchoides avenae]